MRALILSALLLSGCAVTPIETPDDQPVGTRVVEFVKRHPVATWVAAGVIAGSIAASTDHRTPHAPGDDLCREPLSCK
jgi:hypothetical protein